MPFGVLSAKFLDPVAISYFLEVLYVKMDPSLCSYKVSKLKTKGEDTQRFHG
jgi:hypothetical protein